MHRPSRTIRFVAKEDSKVYYGAPVQSGDLGLLYHAKSPITAHVLSASPLSATCTVTSTLRTVARLLSPLAPDEIKTIRGMGMQFAAPGAKVVKPEVAVLFYKPTTSISGPEDPIFIPASARGMNNDYEVELCAVLGKKALNVSVADALDYVGWYFCAAAWCPIGPCLVSRDQIRDPQNLRIETKVNGVTKQLSNTSEMILSVAELISQMSQGVTLEAGSIILTGTPLPLNRAVDKDPWLKHGDDVRVEVEGCGTLINKVVEEGGVGAKAKL